jgi:hypothetical protein
MLHLKIKHLFKIIALYLVATLSRDALGGAMTLASFVVTAFAIFRTVAFLANAAVQCVSVIPFLKGDNLEEKRENSAYRASFTVCTCSVLLGTVQAHVLVVSVAF